MNITTIAQRLSLLVLLVAAPLSAALAAQATPAPPQLAAKSYVLMDAASGNVLVENNSDQRLPPASLTKLMTAYIATLEIRKGKKQVTQIHVEPLNPQRMTQAVLIHIPSLQLLNHFCGNSPTSCDLDPIPALDSPSAATPANILHLSDTQIRPAIHLVIPPQGHAAIMVIAFVCAGHARLGVSQRPVADF